MRSLNLINVLKYKVNVMNMNNVDSYMMSLHSMQLERHIVTSNIMTYKNVNESNMEDISDNVEI